MTHSFIKDLAIIMMVAGFVTFAFRQMKQPVVLGYIIAGIIIGPHTPPFNLVTNEKTIQTLADVGIVFLMFCLGLHFNLGKLRSVGRTALTASSFEIVVMMCLGFLAGKCFHWNTIDCLFLGAILAISSTTIIVKALHELKLTHERFSDLIFGILIAEDILGVVMMAMLSAIALTDSITIYEFVDTFGRLGIFMIVLLVLSRTMIGPIFRYISSFHSNEGTLIVALGLCFSSALLAAKLGYSEALGAFMMGAIISETPGIDKIDHLIEPIRDMFSAIFFVTVGMLINPALMLQYAWPIAILTAIVVVGKAATCTLGTRFSGNNWQTSFKVGLGLTQIGEFSFIIAALGDSLDVTSPFLYPVAVSVSAVTTIITPYLIKNSDRISNFITRANR